MPPPSSLTPELTDKLVALVRAGNAFTVATSTVGIARSTFYAWLERGESEEEVDAPFRELRERIEQARSAAEATNMAQVARAAAKDWRAAVYLLERAEGRRAGDTPEAAESVPGAFLAASERARSEALLTLDSIGEDPDLSEGAIDAYVSASAVWAVLEAEWEAAGRPSLASGGATGRAPVPHPLIGLIATAREQVIETGDVLGLNPMARRRLNRTVGRPAGAASAADRAAPPRRRLRAVQ